MKGGEKDLIRVKKIPYPIKTPLRDYLTEYGREYEVPIQYEDLLRYADSISLYDNNNEDTLWETVFYTQDDMQHIYLSLKKMYAYLKAGGNMAVMEHLSIDRIDICTYGNTRPFRVRIVNKINDNFDYFYIKYADASRVYGLELEHLLSPNRISFFVSKETLIEEHIAGIPGDVFFKQIEKNKELNRTRIAKEFVKFNERCFVRLLGDMRPQNFVIESIPDFDDVHYRIRAIDFDQQCYEGIKTVYLPQYYKQNQPILDLCMELLTPESVKQYQEEERSLMAARLKSSRYRISELGNAVRRDQISKPESVESLKRELFKHYNDRDFLSCNFMGEIVKISLRTLVSIP